MANIKQHADGSASFESQTDSSYSGRVGGPSTGTASVPKHRASSWAVFGVTGAVTTAGGLFAWRPEDQSRAHYIVRLGLDITTASTGASTVDIGTATASTTLNDTLIDGLSGASTGLFDNVENQGTNGVGMKKLAAGSYVTGSQASGDTTGLVGNVFIEYIPV
jgi:hypothetical protein